MAVNMNDIQAGDRVTYTDRFGQSHTGRATIKGKFGWVLNMGGRHGTPAVPKPEQITKVVKSRNPSKWARI